MKSFILFLCITASLLAGDWHWIDRSDIYQSHGLTIHDHNFTFQILDWYDDGRKILVLRQGNEYESYIWDDKERTWRVAYISMPNNQVPASISGGWFTQIINPLYFTIADYDADGDWDFIYNEFWIHENIGDNQQPRYRLVDPYFNMPSKSDHNGVYNFTYHPFFLDYDGDGVLDVVAKTRNGDAALCKGDTSFTFTYLADVTAGALPRLQDFNADGILDVVSWLQWNDSFVASIRHEFLHYPQDSDLPFQFDNGHIENLPFGEKGFPVFTTLNRYLVSHYQLYDFDRDGDLDIFYSTDDRHIIYAPNTMSETTDSDTLAEKWGRFNGETHARPAFRSIPGDTFDAFTFIQQANFGVSSGGIFYGNTDLEWTYKNALDVSPKNTVSLWLNRFKVETSPRHNNSYKHNLTIAYQDVNGDNVQDMIRSFQYLEGTLYISDNWQGRPHANDLYLNQGTQESPDWVYESTLLQKFNDPDTLFLNLVVKDVDGDGSLDALVKRNGIFTFYTNVGTFVQPEWRESRKLYSGLPLLSDSYPAQRYLYHGAFADLDHDNIDDLVFGTKHGNLYAFKNMRQDTLQWQFWRHAFNVSVDSCSVPAFSDVDRDGDMDLFVGDKKGFLYFYENASTVHVADHSPVLPTDFHCSNFPNPFNASTTIYFELPHPSHVSLNIYDIRGRVVKQLLNQSQTAGAHRVTWDGTDSSGNSVAAGIYFYQIEFTDALGDRMVLTKKMSLVK